MVRVAVVEDEDIYVKQITGYLQQYQKERGEEVAVTVYRDGDEITTDYHGQFDIIYCQNKGYLVNLKYVEGIEDRDCTVHGETLPVAKAKKKEFMEKFAAYVMHGR